MSSLFQPNTPYTLHPIEVSESCPSNIALIKYWGKYPVQLPANANISYTLNACRSETTLSFQPNEKFAVKTFLDGELQELFSEKIAKYFQQISEYLPWIMQGSFIIKTHNTFPHSSGIASSASGFGAIAKALMSLDKSFTQTSENALQKASFLARIGSGSACRSLYNGLVSWGKHPELAGSSDEFATPLAQENIAPVFKKFHDWVLLVHEGVKSVSSSVGHGLMKNHPYAQNRFAEANANLSQLLRVLQEGDMDAFIKITEHEALTLHAMMMMSDPAFILMKNGTLNIINSIWDFRKETGLPVFFTLDAGANVHVLFPENEHSDTIKNFITQNLLKYTQNGNCVKDYMDF